MIIGNRKWFEAKSYATELDIFSEITQYSLLRLFIEHFSLAIYS
jgi:hypothetical protein